MRIHQVLIFCAILLVAVIGGSFLYAKYKYQVPEYTACTMEAKICPDGSTVGRSGPKCEFAECPPSTATTSTQATTTTTATTTVKTEPSKTKPIRSLSGKVLAGSLGASPLLEFNRSDYLSAVDSKKLIVLFFYTSWDQFSQSEFESLESTFDSLPSGAIGFRAHFNDSITSADEKLLARDLNIGATRTKIIMRGDTVLLKTEDAWMDNDFKTEISSRM